jgi:hypothetical protein
MIRWRSFILGWISIPQGLCQIFTLGHYSPTWDMDFLVWASLANKFRS